MALWTDRHRIITASLFTAGGAAECCENSTLVVILVKMHEIHTLQGVILFVV